MNILLYKRYRKEALEWVHRLSAGNWIGLQYGNLKKDNSINIYFGYA